MSQTYTDDCFASGHVAQTDMQNIENNFAALKSTFSGGSAPSNLVAGMWWYDTSANILKLRNEANDAWQSIWDFANSKPVITNLSAEITGAMIAAAIKDAAAGTASLRTLGTGAAQACAGNDSRLIGPDVGQAELKTSSGSVETKLTSVNLTLPGGAYGFYPRIYTDVTGYVTMDATIATAIDTDGIQTSNICLSKTAGGGAEDVGANQLYVTASGEVHWVFILVDRGTGKHVARWQAPDHVCFGNYGCIHPFPDYNQTKHEILVINPDLIHVQDIILSCIPSTGGGYMTKGKLTARIPDDPLRPDRNFLKVFFENYEIVESKQSIWPDIPITVGLPRIQDDKIVSDWRMKPAGTKVKPVKAVIKRPDYITPLSYKKRQVGMGVT